MIYFTLIKLKLDITNSFDLIRVKEIMCNAQMKPEYCDVDRFCLLKKYYVYII